ncbi:MAG: type III glutamate--ammonia ligase, partial [Synechococcaceae cyanobacterium]
GDLESGGNQLQRQQSQHMVRIPDDQRLELRLPDGSAHPYLLQAAILAAGLDGLRQRLDPGRRHDNDNYASPLPPGDCKRLPADLGEALEAFSADGVLREALGEEFCQAYERLRRRQWLQYRSEVSSWEMRHGLEG